MFREPLNLQFSLLPSLRPRLTDILLVLDLSPSTLICLIFLIPLSKTSTMRSTTNTMQQPGMEVDRAMRTFSFPRLSTILQTPFDYSLPLLLSARLDRMTKDGQRTELCLMRAKLRIQMLVRQETERVQEKARARAKEKRYPITAGVWEDRIQTREDGRDSFPWQREC